MLLCEHLYMLQLTTDITQLRLDQASSNDHKIQRDFVGTCIYVNSVYHYSRRIVVFEEIGH